MQSKEQAILFEKHQAINRLKTNNPMPRQTLSKTSFMTYLACPGELWMQFHQPMAGIAPSLDFLHKVEQGNLIDRLAKDWFLNYAKGMGIAPADIHFQKTIKTEKYYNRADIVVQKEGANEIILIEVKASTRIDSTHVQDLAFQKMVFEKAGFTVTQTAVIYVNTDYRFSSEGNYENLLSIGDCTDRVGEWAATVETLAEEAYACINGKKPPVSLLNYCGAKLDCAYLRQHFPNLSDYHVGKIARINTKKFHQLLELNITDILDVPDDFKLSGKQRRQVDLAKNKSTFIQPAAIEKHLSNMTYPLYFLDYESLSYVTPFQAGFGPYQQMVFQYSLHTITEPGAEVRHTGYTLKTKEEPVTYLLQRLQTDIATTDGTVIVWNKGFECGRHKEMAAIYPEFREFLLSLNERVYDLMEIFSKGYFRHHLFRGKSSLKSVLPVLCSELSYADLTIGNGMTACIRWHQATTVGKMTEGERKQVFEDLGRYCELDTWAMVRIWEEVRNIV